MADGKAIDLTGVAEIRDWAKDNFTPAAGVLQLSASWAGDGPYTQAVTIPGATANSKIDLQPDAAVLTQLSTDGVKALWVQNDSGSLTVYALGAAPAAALAVQYTRTEVAE